MKLELYEYPDWENGTLIGTIAITNGVATPDTDVAHSLIQSMGPRLWNGEDVTPESGEPYLRAIAAALSGPWLRSRLIDD